MESDSRRLPAAAFLAQALGIADDPAVLARDLVAIDARAAVAVFAAELDSSVGPAAFLVYAYATQARDEDGRTGRERFDSDLAILETAATRGAPGPRAVAHALAGDAAFILATSPATLRALTGDDAGDPASAELPAGDPAETRGTAAEELLRLLRAADGHAAAWLAAAEAERERTATFTSEETELALFLLDERSIRNLLRAIDRIISVARDRAADAIDEGPAPPATGNGPGAADTG